MNNWCSLALCQAFGIVLKNLVDNANERIQFGSIRCLPAAITWGRCNHQHLINRAAVNVEHPCRYAVAHTLNLYHITYSPIEFHMLHPHPPQKAKSLPLEDFNSGKQPDNLAASVRDYCTGVLMIKGRMKSLYLGTFTIPCLLFLRMLLDW